MTQTAADMAQALGDAFSPAMQDLDVPGVAVGVLAGGEAATWSSGVTNRRHPLPVTPSTIFQLGSISKTFVATAAMSLVETGRLQLDDPIVRYVPNLRLSTERLTQSVTTLHLLTHTSGWVGDYFGDTGQGDDALARFAAKLAKAPQLTPPGWTYSYNNSAFNLAAHVVASAAGAPYEQVVRDTVLRPLGMRHTGYTAEGAITHRVAAGHRHGDPQPWRRPRAHSGAGGVLSTVDDLLAYARFHLRGEPPILTDEDRLVMQRAQRPAGSLCDHVGLAWMIDEHRGHTMVHHGGTTNGYQTDLRLVPDLDLAWILLTNSDHHHQLDRIAVRTLLGDAPLGSDYRPADLAPYAGHSEAVLAELYVVAGDDGLSLQISTPVRSMWDPTEPPPAPEWTKLRFRDEDRVVALDMPWTGHRAEFVRDDAGEVAWLRWDGRIARRTGPARA